MTVRLAFADGTLRVESDGDGFDVTSLPGVAFDERTATGRAPAMRYADVVAALDGRGVDYEDDALDAAPLAVASDYELRGYQQDALDAWTTSDRRGVLELPTGSGKTVIGLKAIEAVGEAALVVVPTIDLLVQWRRELAAEFDCEVGQLGGGEQVVGDVTVATYDSAYLRAEDLGDRFGLVVFDEVHHLGGEGFRDIARMLAAPARLGLTATFERPDGAHEVVAELVGPLVYDLDVDDLAGDHLADYDVKRLEVPLTDEERAAYEDAQGTFTDYLTQSNIQFRSGSDYQELVKRSGTDPRAREALLAKQRARRIVRESDAKVAELEAILDAHRDDRVIVFTASTDLVYRLSERFLVPAITHETTASERDDILDRFRRGDYSRVVTANVLDEGVDVPDANVAVVVAGSGSEREFTQRLGRILRPKDDGGRALLYELVSADTAEERVAARRR
ncbi:DEAD/DEAH box helicase [Halobacterium jilantaiense]|uniref:DNA 3'-5' helicase n=1 Tax=Halobacterium jilantaiense TaxID=355548 RepID=A0A1I0NPI0_9EURY|nr:DEAD/DEAH box helicase family protein [Halobacterium jilantaiense]SEW03377.1 Superfamily II DNA or RNA helicase [Halobacterium jilantaiense]